MGFFDKLSDTLWNTGKDVTQKAKDLTDSAKLSMEIRSNEDMVRHLYTEIGRQYYEEHKNEKASPYEEMDQIKELLEAIDNMKKELLVRKGAKVCPRCGKQVQLQDVYCKCCGAKIEDDEPVVDAVVKEAPDAEPVEAADTEAEVVEE